MLRSTERRVNASDANKKSQLWTDAVIDAVAHKRVTCDVWRVVCGVWRVVAYPGERRGSWWFLDARPVHDQQTVTKERVVVFGEA